ncbi:MAG: hypothetical protein IPP72_07800, partial [Chitinophagaceae bacterium]|nr:hypothetical protein [Chitinophagaceae bacterium]
LLLPKISIGNVNLLAPVTAPLPACWYNTNRIGGRWGFYYWNGTSGSI